MTKVNTNTNSSMRHVSMRAMHITYPTSVRIAASQVQHNKPLKTPCSAKSAQGGLTEAVPPTPNLRSQTASRSGTKTPRWQERIGARAQEERPIGGGSSEKGRSVCCNGWAGEVRGNAKEPTQARQPTQRRAGCDRPRRCSLEGRKERGRRDLSPPLTAPWQVQWVIIIMTG